MAKIRGALFSMDASGSVGELIFDRRGYAYFKPRRQDKQTPEQGNYRLAMAVAQKCVKTCGDTTRQKLREIADNPAYWGTYLTKQLIGPQRSAYQTTLAQYTDPAVNQPVWEATAASIGLREIQIPYALEAGVSPGAQLFVLASTLFSLGVYSELGQPNGNAPAWKDSITS